MSRADQALRESVIEKSVTSYADSKGWVSIKLNGANDRAKPDHAYFKDNQYLVVEFKAPNKTPSKLQLKRHRDYADRGVIVRVIDSVEAGRELFA